ncbi:hypothetical protein Bca52824_096755 [Brassica carinata]|uniref:Uncharacterized protein n=1 Tax=Brassica carinata TaxID=52824 RepID=A0A8X7TGY1_BRACI|nr:hypothetical protein Bca52824_096755 [Brassica carinata]
MVAKKGRQDSSSEVGEIDTSAPFQSVKHAVNLFGEAALSADNHPLIRKPTPQSAEKVLVKQTELHLAQKELNKLKEQVQNAESPRVRSRKRPEAASVSSSDEYGMVCKELDAAKQELRKIRQTVALRKEEEAKEVTKVYSDKIQLLREEITAVNESVEQTKLACSQARKEQSEIFSEKEIQQQLYKAGMEESAKKLLTLKKEFDPEVAKKLEAQLSETYNEIDELQKQMEDTKASSDVDSVNGVSLELNEAKGLLEKFVEEEKSLQESVESLKAENRT